jgi:hypothetical protein
LTSPLGRSNTKLQRIYNVLHQKKIALKTESVRALEHI